MDSFQGKIEGLRLSNFTCFADLELDFSEGINVFIGENGLGKTHLLKVLFWLGDSGYEKFSSHNEQVEKSPESDKTLVIADKYNRKSQLIGFPYYFGLKTNSAFIGKNKSKDFYLNIRTNYFPPSKDVNHRFIPVMEILSWYKGFIPAFENRESSIDAVYYYLAKALEPLPLKGEKLKEQTTLIHKLEQALGFQVVRQGDEFLIAFKQDQVHNTKLVANGINKIAQLIYLVMNGSLTKNSILFWDEPEAGLNPKYIVLVAEFLQTLAQAGCQIFVATHDYLLSQTLSLAAEYRDVRPDTPLMRFFSLYSTPDGTQIESAETLPELQHNSILEEYARFYKTEEELFYQSMKVKG